MKIHKAKLFSHFSAENEIEIPFDLVLIEAFHVETQRREFYFCSTKIV
jgi:hypothetical protein